MVDVLDEHIGYLSLHGRTEQFAQAIAQAMVPGARVADLGCGVGVLGLLCLKAGAARVWGIDHSDAIYVAREAVSRAGFSDSYECLRESTFQARLPELVDLIICDHVGFFGFDYGIVEMLADARRLLKPGGAIMPRRLNLQLAGVSSIRCREIADAWIGAAVPDDFHWLHEFSINARHPVKLQPADICTAVVDLGSIDLTADNPDSFAFDAVLDITADGQFDGLAGWFNAELAAGVWMTNSPVGDCRIDRPQAFLPCREPFAVRVGDRITVSVKIFHPTQIITWTICDPATGRRQRQSTFNSKVLTDRDLTPEAQGPVALGRKAEARRLVLDHVDGTRSATEIEDAIVLAHPDLLPTQKEIRNFVRRELRASRW